MLHVHRAERSARLAEALADVLVEPLDDPFAAEVVAVPTRGVERWLAQRLAHRLGTATGDDGVCANVAFGSPADLVARALGTPDDDPWRAEHLVWPLLETIDTCAGELWCAPLGHYLGVGGPDKGRRFSAARHLARLFATYAEHRPAMVRRWAAKDDVDVPDDLRWQSELWRRLRERVGVPSQAETLDDDCATLRGGPRGDLPPRLSVFGPTRLSATHLQVIDALGAHRDVHLWIPHSSPALWDAVRAAAPAITRRAEDTTAGVLRHPLLASLARDVRELQVRLAGLDTVDHHHPAPDDVAPTTLLARLQRDLRDDAAPAGQPCTDDDSVAVHACHGPDRQVEVLREVILGLLARDPTLEPRDVVVLCPDIETFAPLITASFGNVTDDADAHPGHRLRVRLADRSLTQVNPLLATVATLLELADSRVTASQLLDLAESAPVRRRFGFDDDDLERLRELVARSGVRWGLDAAHRAPFAMSRFADNTWERGLDRLLVGVAMSGDEPDGVQWLDTALPLDDVDSGDADRVGRLGELVDRVAGVVDDLRGEHPLSHWIETLQRGLDSLTSTTPSDAWQAGQARAELAEVRRRGDEARTLTLHDVRAVLAERLAGRPTRANFRTGTLTVATLMPMRSIPHRVVCLLGLDDQVFPRRTRADGDDVLARDPLLGERDPAGEDRQLLLDAIGAAGEHLVVVHSGADERTNAPRPPAVPIGELLDALDAMASYLDGRPTRAHVTVRHPLQPFAAADFAGAAPFSFDRAHLAGARALAAERAVPVPFLAGELSAQTAEEIPLDQLVGFVEHPVRAFLRQRLGVFARGEEGEPDEALPVEPNGLDQWQVGSRLLADRLDGRSVAACIDAEVRRGTLPPGGLGQRLVRRLGRKVEPLVAAAAPWWTPEVRDVDAAVALDGDPGSGSAALRVPGPTLLGAVSGVRGQVIVTVTYSNLGPKHRLAAWVRLLALTVAHPEVGWRAVTIGKAPQKNGQSGVLRSTLGPVDPATARATLHDLVALRGEGLRAPLPLMAQSSEAYARARAAKSAPVALGKARDRWNGRYGEHLDAAHVLVWGRRRAFDELVGPTTGSADTEPTRFGALALRLWTPLREHEETGT